MAGKYQIKFWSQIEIFHCKTVLFDRKEISCMERIRKCDYHKRSHNLKPS